MAIWGIDATGNRLADFLEHGVAYTGRPADEEPTLYNQLRRIQLGDLIFAKTYAPGDGLAIHAIGVVVNSHLQTVEDMPADEPGLIVKWQWHGETTDGPYACGPLSDHLGDVRGHVLYEEYNDDVRLKVVELLFVGTER